MRITSSPYFRERTRMNTSYLGSWVWIWPMILFPPLFPMFLHTKKWELKEPHQWKTQCCRYNKLTGIWYTMKTVQKDFFFFLQRLFCMVLYEYVIHLISMCKTRLNMVVIAPCCSVVDARCSLSVNKSAAVDQWICPLLLCQCVCLCVCVSTYACKIYILVFVFACMMVMHALCVSLSVWVCVSLRQPSLSSLDNQSLALVRQPSEAERSKAEADDHHSVCACVRMCVQQR